MKQFVYQRIYKEQDLFVKQDNNFNNQTKVNVIAPRMLRIDKCSFRLKDFLTRLNHGLFT